jgi:hypothetical protein
MSFVRTLFFLLFAQVVCAQTVTQQDHIIALKRLRVGVDTSKYWTTIATIITNAATHRQGTTAKAVYDFIIAQGYISVTGTPTTGQTIKWNGTNWVPSTDAGAWQYRTVTTTIGSANFTAFGSLTGISIDNMRVTRNGQLYKVGLSNCSDCQVSYNSTTQIFTLSRAVIAQETIQLQIIQ